MKRNAVQQLLRLLAIAGVAFIWLTIPAIGGPSVKSLDRYHPKLSAAIDHGRLPYTMKLGEVLFEKFIHFQENGEHFIYASTPPEGSGAFTTEAVFWIAPDGTTHPVVFEHAGRAYENQVNEGESILTGGPGILFSRGSLRFEFFIANEGDFHCCPTAGKISGTYKIVGEESFDPETKEYSCTFKLVPGRYKREISSSSDSSTEFSEK
jgi:hypothetical protein